jgi:phenylacetate-CoA ligase
MHVFEDAFVTEVVDPDTGVEKAAGEKGVIYQTTLFKHLAPLIRFNSNDVSAWASGTCPCGSVHHRLERIYGRNDNMVKLRGTNVFPEAIGALVTENPQSNGEYVCVVERVDVAGREEMTVLVEAVNGQVPNAELEKELGVRFKEALGVKLIVKVVEPGHLADMTGLSNSSKARRLIDKRS